MKTYVYIKIAFPEIHKDANTNIHLAAFVYKSGKIEKTQVSTDHCRINSGMSW